jgi:ABC-type uncharacterized transport system substrate-binding protein
MKNQKKIQVLYYSQKTFKNPKCFSCSVNYFHGIQTGVEVKMQLKDSS